MGTIRIDTSRLPLLHVVYDGVVNDEEFEAYLVEYAGVLDRRERYAAVFDASRAGSPSGDQRRSQARWMRQQKARLRELCVGGSFIITNSIVRGAFTAILWLHPLPFEHSIFRHEPEATRWAIKRLQHQGLAPPPDVVVALPGTRLRRGQSVRPSSP